MAQLRNGVIVLKRIQLGAVTAIVMAVLATSACAAEPVPKTPRQDAPTESAVPLRFSQDQIDGWTKVCNVPTPDPGTRGAIVVSPDGTGVSFTAYYSDVMVDVRSQGKVTHVDNAMCILKLAGVDESTMEPIVAAEGGHHGVSPIEGGQIAWEKPTIAVLSVTLEASD